MKRIFIVILFLSGYGYGQDLKSFYNGNIQLFYEEQGKGPALYILTGGPGHHQRIPLTGSWIA